MLIVVLIIALEGWGSAQRRFRRAGAPAVMSAVAVLVAIVLNRVREALYGADLHIGLNPFPDSLRLIPNASKRIVPELIGDFGSLDARLPAVGLVAGYGLIGAVVAIALWRATKRERSVLLAATAVAIVMPGIVHALVYRHTGFWIQGRYFMPVLLVVPLLAGEIALRHGEWVPGAWRRLTLLLFGGAALLQIGGWYANARRHAVGTDGPAWFFDRAEWSPRSGGSPGR